ncbi:GntR family transcriptional regulator [Gracilinema caldarium]|uniref:Transcriptional regulator, GntR family n=1 Tax=Gracilinema caldarium (strain ATCC 51460 / DSM 7334 / H1) TaxID=744872 RepID=F8EZM0_GRAC1|nr:GntR family transcriptional regulator [Gracilinema caldarium]AEJ20744.1 transcriptional regulator, GntR family [Gracilinema caldarium DSM 7334]
MKFNDDRPIFEQIAQLLEDRILSGAFTESGRLPSARELASSLEVNPNTAARALQYLADMKLAYAERGSGYFVAPGAAEHIRNLRRERFFSEELPRVFGMMRSLEIQFDELLPRWESFIHMRSEP